MKLTIDTTQKKVSIEGSVKISELIKVLKGMNIDVDEWAIEVPVISVPWYPYYPQTVYDNGPIVSQTSIS